MADESDVRIIGWPAEPVQVSHQFEEGKPCPVAISFENTPVSAILATAPGQRLAVDMNMALRALEALPICIKLCEPLCAESNYEIGITLFDRPIISITLKGVTKLMSCREEL
jgi:hypothetical protein